MKRVLIVKLGAIGDVIMLIPAAHQLHLQGYSVDWVSGATVLPILRLYPWINPILADEDALLTGSTFARLKALLALWRNIAFRRYSLVATLYYDRRYSLLAAPARSARRLSLSVRDRIYRLLPGRHHTDEYARILLERTDTLNPEPLPPLPVTATALPASPLAPSARSSVVLAPAGARNLLADDVLRRWPPESYARLAALLLDQQIDVVLIGSPTDTWVQPIFSGLPVTDLIGQLTLPQTLALLDSGTVLVTHDTGPLHLAGITSAGIVALFGPTDPRGRLPQRPGALALWGGDHFACRPCYDGHSFADCPRNDCIRQLTPEFVFAETVAMLDNRARGIYPPPRINSPATSVIQTHA